ncbi:tautomerase family protein [Rouxiella sp. S1S-2]|uniref:tautomerase family protein n=1 Tax=Rouxiella sp. S1S-2 TaxID=2653856 RepID=UPI0012652229|nr:tautomerase family protein [Rouxiella sp. S1S-2]KAB7895657.1 tautomerase family protein [Rouxiella sp. S1S-2]
MPITRISLPRQRLNQWQSAISSALQQALESRFNVPAGDCFQLFDCYDPELRVIDRHYLCGAEAGRSEDYLLFQITAGKPRSTEQKQALYSRLVELLQASIGIRAQDVMVVVSFTEPEDWSFGSGEMFQLSSIPTR